jgi:4-amino-4-deoxy-L-arabinose transferase-like glycosyltransferase
VQLRPRPTGVTVLAVLAVLAGIFSVASGVLLSAISPLASVLLLANGIFDFVLAIGYLGGNGWAWVLGIVFGVINIAGSFIEIAIRLSSNIIGIIISIITIYYLTRPHVKVFFERGPTLASANLPTALGSSMSTSSNSAMLPIVVKCRNCGASIPAGAMLCRDCGTIQ